jgi:hypothetical protein
MDAGCVGGAVDAAGETVGRVDVREEGFGHFEGG